MRVSNKKVNDLVYSYKQGNHHLLKEISEIVLPIIQKHSDDLFNKVSDNTKFDCRCYLKVKQALNNLDGSKGNFLSLVMDIITNEKSDFLERRSDKKEHDSIESLAGFGKDENIGIQIVDNLAVVDSDMLAKEKISFLAEGDFRKETVLTCWKNGYGSDSDIADLLADKFGGNQESYRKFIQRFRSKCRVKLANDY